MKKSTIFSLLVLVVTGFFVSFTAGYFVGSASNDQPFTIQVLEQAPVEETVVEVSPTPSPGPVDVNTATAEELTALHGIGSSLAEAIVDDRNLNGLFTQPEDLLRVSGIGEATLSGFIDDITLSLVPSDVIEISETSAPTDNIPDTTSTESED